MRSLKAFAFACLLGTFGLQLSGCGGGGNLGGGGNPPPTVLSVTETGVPATMQAGSTTNKPTCSVAMSDGTPNSSCKFASSNTAVASYDALTATLSAVAPGTTTITATSIADSTKSSAPITLTVTAAAATITSVSVVATPSTITTAQTSQCVATVTGTGAFSSAVTWTATGGTITSSGVLTPAAAAPATCTATSTADSTKSGSANVTVTQGTPTITKLSASSAPVYLDGDGVLVMTIYGTGFTSTNTIKVTSPGNLLSATLTSSTAISVALNFGTSFYSPGWFGFTICEANGTTCSNTMYFAFIGNQNTLAKGAGELYQNDQAQGNPTGSYNDYIRKFTVVNGVATAVGSLPNSFIQSISFDNKTGYLVGGRGTADSNWNAISLAADDGNGSDWIGQDANNGLSCGVRPAAIITPNLLSCFAVGVQNAPMQSITLGTEPWTVAMAKLSDNKTHAFVISRKGTPILSDVDATNANLLTSYPLTGFTDSTTIQASSLQGGWELAAFETGPATGIVASMSNYDKLLVFINAVTKQQIGQPIVLTGSPFRIAKDETNGNVVVAFADLTDPSKPKSTFASVNPTTGTVTPLASTSSNLAVGFAVSSDGKYLYACQRAACDIQPNK